MPKGTSRGIWWSGTGSPAEAPTNSPCGLNPLRRPLPHRPAVPLLAGSRRLRPARRLSPAPPGSPALAGSARLAGWSRVSARPPVLHFVALVPVAWPAVRRGPSLPTMMSGEGKGPGRNGAGNPRRGWVGRTGPPVPAGPAGPVGRTVLLVAASKPRSEGMPTPDTTQHHRDGPRTSLDAPRTGVCLPFFGVSDYPSATSEFENVGRSGCRRGRCWRSLARSPFGCSPLRRRSRFRLGPNRSAQWSEQK